MSADGVKKSGSPRTPQARARARGKDNERLLVERLHTQGYSSAKRVPLSGALSDLPGDVTVEELALLLEAKVYAITEVDGARYIRIDLHWLEKIQAEAKRAGYEWSAVAFRGKGSRTFYVLATLENCPWVAKSQESC